VKISPKLLSAACLAAFSALAFAAVEPSATLLENDQVKVVRALEKAHVKGSFHEHKVNRVMIYLQDGKQHFEYKDGRPGADFAWKAGQVVWSKADGMHQPEVVSDEPFNIIEIELKNPPAAPAGKVKASGDILSACRRQCTLEFENDQVRVIHVRLSNFEKASRLNLTHNSVRVYLSGKKAGQAIFDKPGRKPLENIADGLLEFVIVELKS
jgi:hypothetical protein